MEKNKRRFFFSVFIQDLIAVPLAKLLIKIKCNPNFVTLLGLFFAISSGVLYLYHEYILGSLLFFGALVLDSTDGRVARGTNSFSSFGAKLDAITDKTRSFFVAYCLLFSLDISYFGIFIFFSMYIFLPLLRAYLKLNNKNFYDPTISFWDSTPFKQWFISKGVLGFYTGWERSVLALLIAPLTIFKLEIFILAIIIENILFFLGLIFFRKNKVGI